MDLANLIATPTGAKIALFHGTNELWGQDIVANGVDAAAANQHGTGEFWATPVGADAEIFAQVNPGGPPNVVFSFEISDYDLHAILSANPAGGQVHSNPPAVEFFAQGFDELNAAMRNKQLRHLP